MKKKLIGIATMAAILTLSAGITAFAGWEYDDSGQAMFRNANGKLVYAGWVTDPDTGYEYYMDPDGHVMKGTSVEGYWLDDDGVKHEKSEAQIAAEERRAAREAAYRSPGKETSETNDIANEAKSSGVAVSTTRRNYQAEMYSISNQAFDSVKKAVTAYENKSLKGASSKTNISNKFYYYTKEGVDVLESDMPKAAEGTDAYYEYSLELHYNRNVVHEEDAVEAFNSGFLKMLIGALGEEQGNYVYDEIMAIPVGDDDATLELTGTTGVGNTYSVRYSNNNAYVYVTCSEIVPEPEEETAEEVIEGEAEEVAEVAEEIADEAIADIEAEDVVISEAAEEQLEEEISEEVVDEIYEEAYEEVSGDEEAEDYEEDYEEDEEEE